MVTAPLSLKPLLVMFLLVMLSSMALGALLADKLNAHPEILSGFAKCLGW